MCISFFLLLFFWTCYKCLPFPKCNISSDLFVNNKFEEKTTFSRRNFCSFEIFVLQDKTIKCRECALLVLKDKAWKKDSIACLPVSDYGVGIGNYRFLFSRSSVQKYSSGCSSEKLKTLFQTSYICERKYDMFIKKFIEMKIQGDS